ncbi:MAG: MoaD/ThiS family protein [Opitutae bacterium]|jgi:molybdopterin converting factor small subunit|nr:MoaD/ThiS family protein [Opitutae bacterium]MBT5908454.1 MoaD/ThiS family protein [Opitutae bacterium]MBT6851815.1 MoaD/ThiS family protein [Opitutae bacterium]MBT7923233.1 MoaD/ThiS family protein [Opitutae bacterium]
MKITLRYTSQLATAAGTSEEIHEVPDGFGLLELLGNLSMEHGPEFSKFVVNDEGKPVTTLVVAVNGTQIDLGKEVSLEASSEVILITPMSGG